MRTVVLVIVVGCMPRVPSSEAAPVDAGSADCCTTWTDACGCLAFSYNNNTPWQQPSALTDDLADADWHLLPDGTREVVRTNHAMTEVWVNVDIAKVHLVHDDGGEERCR